MRRKLKKWFHFLWVTLLSQEKIICINMENFRQFIIQNAQFTINDEKLLVFLKYILKKSPLGDFNIKL
ncbi:hypothetical protein CNEO_180005 [Clostridium neonatale]|nr:hypothetical protein CNEO_180005 [Clostridium neonatale]